jgi:DNA replication licensing factor MCM7
MCAVQSDVDEALRLMRMSKISLTDEAGGRGGVDAISAIYSRVRDDATARRKATYTWAELTALAGQDFTVRVGPTLKPEVPGAAAGCMWQ